MSNVPIQFLKFFLQLVLYCNQSTQFLICHNKSLALVALNIFHPDLKYPARNLFLVADFKLKNKSLSYDKEEQIYPIHLFPP